MVETSAQFISPMGPNMQQPMPPTTVMDLSKNIVQVPTTMVMPTTTMAPTTDASLLNPQQQLEFQQQQQQLQYQQEMQQLPHQQRVNFRPGPPTVFVQPTPNPMASTFRLDTQKMALIKEDHNGILAIGVDPTARNSTLFQASNMLVNGVAPSNQLIDQSINNVKVTLAQNSGMLSEQGMRVVGDVYQVLESLQKFIHAKNGDEKWQRMYRDSSLAGRSAALKGKQQAQLLKASVQMPQLQQPQQYMVEKAKLESKQMMINMRDIIFFIFKSGEFRELLIDFVKLFQSFARRMDEKHGDRLTDSLRSDLLTTGSTTMAPPSATVIQTTQTSEYINIVGPASSATSETILIQNPPSSQPSSSQLKTELTTAAKDTKNILKQESERTRMMEMRLDSLLEKLRSQPQYRDVVRKLFIMYDQFELQFQKHRTMAAQQMQEAAQQNEWNIVFNDAKLIMGDFVGHQPLELFINQCYQLYMTIKNDPAANQYFRDLRIFILNMMQETRSDVLPSQATIVQPTTLGAQDSSIRLQQHKQQISAFVERGKQLFQAEKSQYYVYFKNMASTMKEMFISLRNDRDRLDVSSKVNKLFKDMFMDEHGRPDLFIMQESIVQLNALFGTLLRQQLVSIQLPFVEGQTRRYAFALHNMVLDINRILPDHFNLQLMNNLDHQSYNMTREATKNMTKLHFEADSIQFAIRNVHFDVRQLSGLKYHDYGVADIEVLGNRGLSLEANWEIVSTSAKIPHLRLGRVNCNIDKLNIRILAAHHKALDKIVTKLFKGIIRRRVSAMIRQRMQEQLEYITTRFNILLLERQRELKKIVGSSLVSKSKINQKLKMGYEKTKLGKKKGLLLDETTGMRQETQWTQQPQQLQPQLEQQPLQMQPQMMMQPSAMTTTSATVIETVMPTVVMPTANIEQMPSSVAMSTEGYANSQEAVVASTKIGIVKPDMTSAVTTMAPPPPRPLETTMIERASVRSSTPDTILA